MVAQAGYPDGFDMRIWDTLGGLPLLNQAIAGYWRNIGAKTQLEPIEYGALMQLITPNHKPKLWNSIWIWPSRTQRGFVSVGTRYHSQQNTVRNLKDLRLDELIDKAARTTSADERKRLKTEAAVMAKDEYSSIGIVNLYENLALGPKVGEATPYYGRAIVSTIETLRHPK